jgi:hypothetical protein
MSESKNWGAGQESVVYQIVEEIAEKKDTTVDEVKPLHGSIDTDALTSLFSRPDATLKIDFYHDGVKVVAQKDPELHVNVI